MSQNGLEDFAFIDKLPELQQLYASNNKFTVLSMQNENENLNIIDLNAN